MIKRKTFNLYDDPYISNSYIFSITLIMVSFLLITFSFNASYGAFMLFIFILMSLPRIRRRRN